MLVIVGDDEAKLLGWDSDEIDEAVDEGFVEAAVLVAGDKEDEAVLLNDEIDGLDCVLLLEN